MTNVLQWLLNFLNVFWSAVLKIGAWLLDALFYVVPLIVRLIISGFLELVYAILSALDVGALSVNLAATWGLLDPKVAWMINQTGFPTGLSMLGAAYLIRFTLNIIPAELTRL